MFKIKGILFHVGSLQEFSSNMIKKECIVSRMGAGAYPNLVFEVLGKDIAKLDAIPLNSLVELTFDIHGKSYTTKEGHAKYFNVLRLFNVEPVVSTSTTAIETTKLVEGVTTDKAE
ncbi:MAG: hypothetical protein A3F72_03610 [Bacteroidetes bacterium RIFCSPLOWO2_12_FULL_35_15]|nr:MAG: hypothetical protein A3F72_03610 [Bacteroidetes bacterium RIFCSPLOWO2_12_FULL_35_15]